MPTEQITNKKTALIPTRWTRPQQHTATAYGLWSAVLTLLVAGWMLVGLVPAKHSWATQAVGV